MSADRQLTDIISGDIAARVKRLLLFSRYRVEGQYAGDNPSMFKGFSTEFMQHRQYYPGDNLKHMDWRVYGRTGRFLIREYEEMTTIDLFVVLDNSASMGFGNPQSKHAYAVHVAAILFYLMTVQRDQFGLSLFSDQLVRHAQAGSNRRHLLKLYELLLTHPPAGAANWQIGLRQVRMRLKRKGLILVMSDFMDDPEVIGKGLAAFRSMGCDVIAFHVQHPREMTLNETNRTRYVDIEDHSAETVDPLVLRDGYKRQFRRHADDVRNHCTRRGISYHAMTVGEDYDRAVGEYLRRRMATLL